VRAGREGGGATYQNQNQNQNEFYYFTNRERAFVKLVHKIEYYERL